MSKRRSEQIQPGKGKPAETHITGTPDAANPAVLSTGGGQPEASEENALGKYWIAIIVWAASFILMIVFELMSALFRR